MLCLKPFPTREVLTDTKSAEQAYIDKRYKYTNAKLIKILEITLDEQQHLKTIISSKEKYRRCVDEKRLNKKLKEEMRMD